MAGFVRVEQISTGCRKSDVCVYVCIMST
jgi:hypothetical protein